MCTLFEGVYGHGVVVLVNSLITSGFEGHLYLGYRGDLPGCVTRMVNRLKAEESSRINPKLVELETDRHFTTYKPQFLLDIFEKTKRKTESVWYFDPDIVVNKPWNDFVRWVKYGISICEDIDSPLHHESQKRREWREFAYEWNMEWEKDRDIYFNAGFIGITKDNIGAIRNWKRVIERVEEEGYGISAETEEVKLDESDFGTIHPFKTPDQDALNLALSCYSGPICPVDKSCMGFGAGFSDRKVWMGHAVGSAKPWNASYVHRASRGMGPRTVDRLYWKHADTPFAAHSTSVISLSRFRVQMARVLRQIL